MTDIMSLWGNLEYPKIGQVYIAADFRIFYFHLAQRFLSEKRKLVRESISSRQTKTTGDLFLFELLQLCGGGEIVVEHRGSSNNLIIIYQEGAMLLEISTLGDEFTRPKMSEHISAQPTYAGSSEFVREITKHFIASTDPVESSGNVYAMLAGQSGPEFRSIGHGGETLIRENYSEAVLKNYDRIAETLQAKVPPGRINIMSGPPGTGKTYLIRGLIQQVRKAKFAIVQASSVASLANPGMLPALLDFRSDKQPIVFVIEDAEECLATRDAMNNSTVSALLNMGDGVLGSLIDLRIIATTNAPVSDLDPAIRRPGRLSTICEVGPLAVEEAAVVYHRLTGKEIFPGKNPTYTIAEVYQMATDAGWKGETSKTKPKTLGFSTTPAIDDDDDMNFSEFWRQEE